MKNKSRKLKIRIPMPPPQKPHSTKKGRKKGYTRQKNKHIAREEKRAPAEKDNKENTEDAP
ncbi:MAG: hypothetical protein HYS73_00715 [Parcubacteria group bacterium]|nr:hypothetical protein [Parcubacteria group bacterium]